MNVHEFPGMQLIDYDPVFQRFHIKFISEMALKTDVEIV